MNNLIINGVEFNKNEFKVDRRRKVIIFTKNGITGFITIKGVLGTRTEVNGVFWYSYAHPSTVPEFHSYKDQRNEIQRIINIYLLQKEIENEPQ